jgi:hypothetical protein
MQYNLHQSCHYLKFKLSRSQTFAYFLTLSIFKGKLKRMNIAKVKKKKPTYIFGNRRENIIHCQLQNKASNLNAHLIKDHITYNSLFFYCGHDFEDNFHFFLECPNKHNKEMFYYKNFEPLMFFFRLIIFYMVVQSLHITSIANLFPMFTILLD